MSGIVVTEKNSNRRMFLPKDVILRIEEAPLGDALIFIEKERYIHCKESFSFILRWLSSVSFIRFSN